MTIQVNFPVISYCKIVVLSDSRELLGGRVPQGTNRLINVLFGRLIICRIFLVREPISCFQIVSSQTCSIT